MKFILTLIMIISFVGCTTYYTTPNPISIDDTGSVVYEERDESGKKIPTTILSNPGDSLIIKTGSKFVLQLKNFDVNKHLLVSEMEENNNNAILRLVNRNDYEIVLSNKCQFKNFYGDFIPKIKIDKDETLRKVIITPILKDESNCSSIIGYQVRYGVTEKSFDGCIGEAGEINKIFENCYKKKNSNNTKSSEDKPQKGDPKNLIDPFKFIKNKNKNK